MVPISDANPTRRVPVINLALIGVNLLVFFYELQLRTRALNLFFQAWGVIPGDLLDAIANPLAGGALHPFLTLITSQFIHAGWGHILGNMLFLFIFGDNIEDLMGSVTYLFFYLISGIVAGLTQAFVFAPFLGGIDIPSIGASGAIAGVLGAYLVMFPGAKVRAIIAPLFFLPFSVPAFIVIGMWFLLQFVFGIGSLNPAAASTGGVAYWAHIGGFIAGMLMIIPFWVRARMAPPSAAQRYYTPPGPYDDRNRWP
ncbi:MAG: rhomboid family intramembrane serine protease [Anaerolineae bacterium]